MRLPDHFLSQGPSDSRKSTHPHPITHKEDGSSMEDLAGLCSSKLLSIGSTQSYLQELLLIYALLLGNLSLTQDFGILTHKPVISKCKNSSILNVISCLTNLIDGQ